MRLIATIEDPAIIQRILAQLGHPGRSAASMFRGRARSRAVGTPRPRRLDRTVRPQPRTSAPPLYAAEVGTPVPSAGAQVWPARRALAGSARDQRRHLSALCQGRRL